MKYVVEFLRSGRLLDVGIGTALDQVVKIFGEPEDTIESGDIVLLKYHSLEVGITQSKVCIVSLEVYEKKITLPNPIGIENVLAVYTLEQFTQFLEDEDIGWHICSSKCYDSIVAIVCESEVIAYYELPSVGISKLQVSSLGGLFYQYRE